MLCSVLVWSSEIHFSLQFLVAHDILVRPFGYPDTDSRIQPCGIIWTTEAISMFGAVPSVPGFLVTKRETKPFWSYRIKRHVEKLWQAFPGPWCFHFVTLSHFFCHVHLVRRCAPYVLAAMLVFVLARTLLATTCFLQVLTS